ncbi:MAG: hypothetical protein NTZ80_00180 [Patescibacteria group bacterium]|nr:hypothetical protein [Patescibacteria group bacterium]
MSEYTQITRQIDQNIDLTTLPETVKLEWENVLKKQVELLRDKDNQEELAVASIYLLIFSVKTKLITEEEHIGQEYELIKKAFLETEREYHKQAKENSTGQSKKAIFNQMLYFYKIAEFYITYLEKTLKLFSFDAVANEVSLDKIHFLQKQELLEGNVRKFFAYSRLSFTIFLKKYMFLYALLSGVGIVLFWHGIWGLSDKVIEKFGAGDYVLPYLITTIIGIALLYILGVFLNQTVGDQDKLKDLEDIEIKEISELKTIEKVMGKKSKKSLWI